MNPASARYAAAARQTASPERLMILLFQAALRHLRSGVAALEAGRGYEGATSLSKAAEIVIELHGALDPSKAPQLCEELGEIYRFVALRLNQAALTRDPGKAREAERAFVPIADAFEQAVDNLASQPR
jgi:flagellar protein FliS